MPKYVNHVLGMFRKLSVDKLNSMIRNGFRASPADCRRPLMADPRTIGKWVDGAQAGRWGEAEKLAVWEPGKLAT